MSDSAPTALLEACLEAMQEMQKVSREVLAEMAEYRLQVAETKHIGEDMKAILKIVRDGNGQPSLLQRVRDLELAAAAKLKAKELAAHGSEKTWDRLAMMAIAVISALTTLWVAFTQTGGTTP